jgi:NhaP-type Na+/H+ or K+/H+ antiporter
MDFTQWIAFIGVLLVSMVLVSTLLGRLPLSSAIVYLAVGWALGPEVMNVLRPDPFAYTVALERTAEMALVISLFAVGMKLGVPLRDRRWWLPVRLSFVSMAAMVAMVAALGVWALDLPLGVAVLLGAILAPTDPVLASGVQSEAGSKPDRLGFSLAGEGGLNDGAAYPFVMLGLGLVGMHELGDEFMRWWSVDLLWATLGGISIGAALGAAIGRLVVYLRGRHGEAIGLHEFLSLGLLAMAYGLAQMCLASGFLAVFAAGMALQRVRELGPESPSLHHAAALATHASDMRDSVQAFNEQLEKLAELTLVLLLGAMLSYAKPVPALWWFIPVMLLLLRPLSVLAAVPGERLATPQLAMIGWFGIRGIGSVYYLLLALRHRLEPEAADTIVSLTLWTVAASVIVHGVTAQPLMCWYARRMQRSPAGCAGTQP